MRPWPCTLTGHGCVLVTACAVLPECVAVAHRQQAAVLLTLRLVTLCITPLRSSWRCWQPARAWC